MDLDCHSFSSFDAFVSCTNMFFDKHKASWIRKLRLSIRTPVGVDDTTYLTPWIDSAITHNIQHLDVHFSCLYKGNDPGVVTLPCLKIMQLEYVKYPNEATFVKLISGSPVLEDLTVIRAPTNNSNVLIVCSQTLKRIYINQFIRFDEQNGVVIDAPLLEILMIKCYLTNNLKIINLGLTPKIDIDIPFITIDVFDANDSSKRSVVHNFFASISRARCLANSHATVKVIEKLEPQLQFSYLSQLSASFSMFDLKMLPRILRSCPKLKSLFLLMNSSNLFYNIELVDDRHRKNGEPTVMFSSVPPCLISSLKFVELKSPILGYEEEIELVRYFLKNSRVLEKLSLRFKNHNRKKSKHVILQELLAIPR
ncbi:unnamed protein product, partial [Brassica oleracea]